MAIWKDYISASRLSSFLRRFPNKKIGGAWAWAWVAFTNRSIWPSFSLIALATYGAFISRSLVQLVHIGVYIHIPHTASGEA